MARRVAPGVPPRRVNLPGRLIRLTWDCRRAAAQYHVPLRSVLRRALEVSLQRGLVSHCLASLAACWLIVSTAVPSSRADSFRPGILISSECPGRPVLDRADRLEDF